MTHFGDRLTEANRRTATPLCMGIDPHIHMIPDIFGNAQDGAASDAAIRAINDFSMACLEQAIGNVAAIKPQAAFFEQQGPAGMQILQNLGRAAIDAGLLVIMDAKRGDIGSTSTAYAAGWIGHDAPFPSDALTVNPWLGIDTLAPFLDRADATGSGLFILNRTSNPGAGDLQDQMVDGQPLYQHLAALLAPLATARKGKLGISSLASLLGRHGQKKPKRFAQHLSMHHFLFPDLAHKALARKKPQAALTAANMAGKAG